MIRVTVLVSIGRHPGSGRERRALEDARAVELALSIEDAFVHLVHAGNPDQPVLRDYVGMGAASVTALRCDADADIVPPLCSYLRSHPAEIILAGLKAEVGEGSGHVPYAIAAALDLPLVPGVVSLEIADGGANMLQALSGGRRRRLRSILPVVATVPLIAPVPRLTVFAAARRGRIDKMETSAPLDVARSAWEEYTSRRRPKRLRVSRAGNANERIRAATELQVGKGQVLSGVEPDAAAAAIWSYLLEIGVVREKVE